MSKYILKKDLPDCKAGAMFRWGLSGEKNKNMDVLYNTTNWCALSSFNKDKIINFDEWFEEVKPREWTLYLRKDSSLHSLCEGLNKVILKSENWEKETWDKIIKVREIME